MVFEKVAKWQICKLFYDPNWLVPISLIVRVLPLLSAAFNLDVFRTFCLPKVKGEAIACKYGRQLFVEFTHTTCHNSPQVSDQVYQHMYQQILFCGLNKS